MLSELRAGSLPSPFLRKSETMLRSGLVGGKELTVDLLIFVVLVLDSSKEDGSLVREEQTAGSLRVSGSCFTIDPSTTCPAHQIPRNSDDS